MGPPASGIAMEKYSIKPIFVPSKFSDFKQLFDPVKYGFTGWDASYSQFLAGEVLKYKMINESAVVFDNCQVRKSIFLRSR